MQSNPFKKILFIVLFWAYPAVLLAVTPPIPAQPSEYVVDLAGVIDPSTRGGLNAMLKDLELKTTVQVVVLTLNSLEGEPIETFSHQTAVKWGIGQKGKDNGVLISVAVKDKKYRIEVGYGLEATLPDSLVGSIGRQYLVPNFRKGDFSTGIVAAATEVKDKIVAGASGEVTSTDTGKSPTTKRPVRGDPATIILFVAFILVFYFVLRLPRTRTNRRSGGGGFWLGGIGGGSSGGGWSGGGGDGGGFSGGGGDFGGGGSSGDW